jgi:hypothetical protein
MKALLDVQLERNIAPSFSASRTCRFTQIEGNRDAVSCAKLALSALFFAAVWAETLSRPKAYD